MLPILRISTIVIISIGYVTVVGDGNYIISNPQNGSYYNKQWLSFDQLKEILRDCLPAAEKTDDNFEDKPDEVSKKALWKAIPTDIELLVEDATDASIETGIQ
jgi:hypothetical protein